MDQHSAHPEHTGAPPTGSAPPHPPHHVTSHSAHGAAHGATAASGGQSHHGHMVADFKRRFWVSLVLTVPVHLAHG